MIPTMMLVGFVVGALLHDVRSLGRSLILGVGSSVLWRIVVGGAPPVCSSSLAEQDSAWRTLPWARCPDGVSVPRFGPWASTSSLGERSLRVRERPARARTGRARERRLVATASPLQTVVMSAEGRAGRVRRYIGAHRRSVRSPPRGCGIRHRRAMTEAGRDWRRRRSDARSPTGRRCQSRT